MNHALTALQSVIEWTEDQPPEGMAADDRVIWYAQRMLMIRNCARAGIQAETKPPRREAQMALGLD